jgi:uncharacterized protein (DUF1778 family)
VSTTGRENVGPVELRRRAVRINPRFPEATAERLRAASAIRGQSVAAFIVDAASKEAERVIEEESRWRLGLEEANTIRRLLESPPRVNAAARKAAADLAANVRIRS